jgi:hypothetical protein
VSALQAFDDADHVLIADIEIGANVDAGVDQRILRFKHGVGGQHMRERIVGDSVEA